MPLANVKSRWSGGDLYFYDKSGNEILHIDGSNRKLVVPSGSAFDVSALNQGTGFIPLPLEDWRELATNATINATGNGGLLASDTTPIFERVNGATDKQLRIRWAASNSDELTQQFVYPPDLDDAQPIVVNLLMAMGGATDTPTVAVAFFENVGDTNAGGNTAAVTGTTLARYSVSIAASDVGAYPAVASVSLVVGAHTTDTALLYGSWITYTRKTT